MIKIIHYIWLGGNSLPASVKSCIKTWKKYNPDWDIVEWNETNFPINDFSWVKEAINAKKYAFASDFIRLWVLNKFGGVYCDTDVEFLRPLDNKLFQQGKFICGVENLLVGTDDIKYMTYEGFDKRTGKEMQCFGMQTGFLYSEPGHPFLKYCMEKIYQNGQRRFVKPDGAYDKLIIGAALIWAIKDFGFIFKDETQKLEKDIIIFKSNIFATPMTKDVETYIIHWYDQSWKETKGLKDKLKKKIKKHLYFLFRKIK